jgi:hypothetical protein
MDERDSEQELRRLADSYAAMSDGELEAIAQDPGELTEFARQALLAERDRRQLNFAIGENPGTSEIDWEDLVVLKQFRDLPEALLAQGSLNSAGIESFLADDNMVRMDWFISNLVGGVKLCVRPQDADAAHDLLEQPLHPDFEVRGLGPYTQPTCPHCESRDLSFETMNKPLAYTLAWIGVPIPVPRKRWKCHACGTAWQDSAPQ